MNRVGATWSSLARGFTTWEVNKHYKHPYLHSTWGTKSASRGVCQHLGDMSALGGVCQHSWTYIGHEGWEGAVSNQTEELSWDLWQEFLRHAYWWRYPEDPYPNHSSHILALFVDSSCQSCTSCHLIIYEGYKVVNWQPSKGLNIYRQPRFREIFNHQTTNWKLSIKQEIYSGKKKKRKLGATSSDESMRYHIPKWIQLNLRCISPTKPLFYWYWQKGLNFSDNWQSHTPS